MSERQTSYEEYQLGTVTLGSGRPEHVNETIRSGTLPNLVVYMALCICAELTENTSPAAVLNRPRPIDCSSRCNVAGHTNQYRPMLQNTNARRTIIRCCYSHLRRTDKKFFTILASFPIGVGTNTTSRTKTT